MKIDSTNFCRLSDSPVFLQWLAAVDQSRYSELRDHLRKGLGCNANRTKMVEILNSFVKIPEKARQLKAFLRQHYPTLIVEDDAPQTQPAMLNKHNVFKHYDPDLMTYPKRLIVLELDVREQWGSLEKFLEDFSAKQARCEAVRVDDRLYIEYVALEQSKLVNQIKDWQVVAYRQQNSQK